MEIIIIVPFFVTLTHNSFFYFSNWIFRAREPHLWYCVRILHPLLLPRHDGPWTQVDYINETVSKVLISVQQIRCFFDPWIRDPV
jgi:hypothetical protein